MTTQILVEAAARSVMMGATIYAGLLVLRIQQVRAQRTAWIGALAAAIAMPALVVLHVGPRILPELPARSVAGRTVAGRTAAGPTVAEPTAVSRYEKTPSLGGAGAVSVDRPSFSVRQTDVASADFRGQAETHVSSARPIDKLRAGFGAPGFVASLRSFAAGVSFAAVLYCLVAGFLLVRLGIGLGLAMRLRGRARRVAFNDHEDVRVSDNVLTPVTIGRSILLPVDYKEWDDATLRIVLTHERAHVRQGDFFVQLLAGAHCALFWFNPFSWWLQRELTALGEAMSDLAAVEQAESRASYAEVLLAFATNSRSPFFGITTAGVAMARAGNLRPRIERLLSEKLFRQAASGQQRLTLVAGAVVVLAVVASTAGTRVHAAQTVPSAVPAAPTMLAKPSAESEPVAAPASDARTVDLAPAAYQETPAAPPAPPAPPSPDEVGSGSSSASGGGQSSSDNKSGSVTDTHTDSDDDDSVSIHNETHSHFNKDGMSYAWVGDGDAFALVIGKSQITFSGAWNAGFQRAVANTKGDFIYYRHNGKAYIVQDPALIAQAKALYAPMQNLNRMQAELGAQQAALGAQQEAFARAMESVKIVDTPAVKQQLADLDKTLQTLKTLEDKPALNQEQLSDLQSRLGEIQGRLAELQGRTGERQGEIGEKQGALGEQQGKLGEEQGRIGEQQGKIAEDAQRQLKPLIEQAIRDGKARPVN
jgi:hypothetical protein